MTPMSDHLRIDMVQADLVWEDRKANLAMLSSMLKDLEGHPDLIILPEMFTTGFSMKPEVLAEEENGEGLRWMQQTAGTRNCAVTGSLIIKEKGHYFNRLFWVFPDGNYAVYDKRHLFTLAGEEKHYTAGKSQLLIDYKGWKIMPLICYDLRFPVWSRNVFDYDLAIYVANWPERRRYPWQQLLRARAIENMAFVIGVNRCGTDGNGVFHTGDSACVGPLGETLAEARPGEPQVLTVDIDRETIRNTRKKFGFLNDRDRFTIHSDTD